MNIFQTTAWAFMVAEKHLGSLTKRQRWPPEITPVRFLDCAADNMQLLRQRRWGFTNA